MGMTMEAIKADFDNCVAIHLTDAEELITIAPCGFTPGNPFGGSSNSNDSTNLVGPSTLWYV